MTITLAIDPGVRALGWSVGYEGILVQCGVSRVRDVYTLDQASRTHADRIRAAIAYSDLAVVESMRWRPRDARSNPNDLIDVQTVGILTAHYAHSRDILPVEPVDWKSNLPKAIHHARICAALDAGERAILDAALASAPATNAKEILDAVGILIHNQGRIDRSGKAMR